VCEDEPLAAELDMTGVSLADDIVSRFSLICLDLQRMLPTIKYGDLFLDFISFILTQCTCL
jgi:hypothetical protein